METHSFESSNIPQSDAVDTVEARQATLAAVQIKKFCILG